MRVQILCANQSRDEGRTPYISVSLLLYFMSASFSGPDRCARSARSLGQCQGSDVGARVRRMAPQRHVARSVVAVHLKMHLERAVFSLPGFWDPEKEQQGFLMVYIYIYILIIYK